MELKEAILSTLAELQEDGSPKESSETASQPTPQDVADEYPMPKFDEKPVIRKEPNLSPLHNISSVEFDANEVLDAMIKKEPPLMPMAQDNVALGGVSEQPPTINTARTAAPSSGFQSDRKFLEGLRERILVMFEGMQSPNNRSAEAKIDLILNFFEWQLALIDERLEDKNL